MNFEDKIKELNIQLPEAKAPVGNYVATKLQEKCYSYQDKFLLMIMVN